MATSRHTNEKIKNPIHQAPTHTLLSGVNPNLWWKKIFIKRALKIFKKRDFVQLTLTDPPKGNLYKEAVAEIPGRIQMQVQ